jgi:predicted DNA-binding transcriptional regulator AlpA
MNKNDTTAVPDPLTGHWYSTEELAALLGVDPSSIRRWRTADPPQGPPFVRLSARLTVYSATDVEEWLRRRRTDPEQAA